MFLTCRDEECHLLFWGADTLGITSILESQDIRMEVPENLRPVMISMIEKASEVAENLAVSEIQWSSLSNTQIRLAISSATETVTALMSAALTKRFLSLPPEDVFATQNSSGDLIYRCYHTPDHEWDFTGKLLQ